MGRKTKAEPRTKYALDQDDTKVLEIVGARPEHQPYLWIGSDTEFFGSLDTRHLRELRDAIDKALDA